MAEKKITKRERYTELLGLSDVMARPELVEFIEHELELLARKNTTATGEKKMSAVQKANEELKASIYAEMEENRLYTITEMTKELTCCDGLSTSKVSAMITQMKDAGLVAKTVEKRKNYYSKVC
jgi:DNA-binding transcriptional regulator GbsR (MarR family)